MRRLLLFFCLIFSTTASAQMSALEAANGRWAVEADSEVSENFNCKTSYLTIEIDLSTGTYIGTHFGADTSTATILKSDASWFAIQYHGEERVMDNGELQIWYLIMIEPDKFVWVCEDWITDDGIRGSTEPRVRCPIETS